MQIFLDIVSHALTFRMFSTFMSETEICWTTHLQFVYNCSVNCHLLAESIFFNHNSPPALADGLEI